MQAIIAMLLACVEWFLMGLLIASPALCAAAGWYYMTKP